MNLVPRLRHDCVISNDVADGARKRRWYSHEGFHSKKRQCVRVGKLLQGRNLGCDKQCSNSRCDFHMVQGITQKFSSKELSTRREKDGYLEVNSMEQHSQ